jgi:hypothetical protein
MSADTYVRPWYRFTGYGCDCSKQPKGWGPLGTREDDRGTQKEDTLTSNTPLTGNMVRADVTLGFLNFQQMTVWT